MGRQNYQNTYLSSYYLLAKKFFLLLLNNYYQTASLADGPVYDALIIGAGIAGLAAAKDLTRKGLSYLILEAQPTIGGRIREDKRKNKEGAEISYDVGASFLHKPPKNPLVELARDAGIPLQPSVYALGDPFKKFESMDMWDDKGNQINLEKIKITLKKVRDFGKFLADNEEKYSGKDSFAFVLNKYCSKHNIKGKEAELMELMVNQIICYDNGEELKRVSAENLIYPEQDSKAQGDLVFYPGSFYQIINLISADVPQHRILLNHEVTKISSYHSKWGAVQAINHETQQRVTFYGRNVVLAVPMTIVPLLQFSFHDDPGASQSYEKMLNNISKLGTGSFNKLRITFESPLRNNKGEMLSTQWQRFKKFSEAFSYITLNQDDCTFTFYLKGDVSREVGKLDNASALAWMIKVLKDVCGEENVPAVESFHFGNWDNNPYSRGAYSYNHLAPADVRQSFTNSIGVVRLAGEYCDPERYGTADGAYRCGRAAARQVELSLSYFPIRCMKQFGMGLWAALEAIIDKTLESVGALSDYKHYLPQPPKIAIQEKAIVPPCLTYSSRIFSNNAPVIPQINQNSSRISLGQV